MTDLALDHIGASAIETASGAPQAETAAAKIPDETLAEKMMRWVLGIAYAMKPARIAVLPALALLTFADMARGGTRIPGEKAPATIPEGFAGVVRDLTPETMMAALKRGYFPWCHCGPVKWWTRSKRMVLFFGEHKLEKRCLREMRKAAYRFTFDTAFDDVVAACAAPRDRNWHSLTWITPRFRRLYAELHRLGHAHSFEIWNSDGQLVGGGFGVSVGRVFYSESLFSRERDVSKMASSCLYYHLAKWGYVMCDGRDYTPMQAAMGYREIPRVEHEEILNFSTDEGGKAGRWRADADMATVAEWVGENVKSNRTKVKAPEGAPGARATGRLNHAA